jgi:hypothetical protein
VGLVDAPDRLELLSKMRTGKLFLDGHHDEHDIGIGDRIVMKRSDETLTVLGLQRNGSGATHAGQDTTRRAPR